jgi:hypothetical protein
MTVARRRSRRLFLATVRFRHAEYDVAIAFARPAERPKPVDDRAIEPDPHLSVRADGPRRAVRQRRLYGVVRGRGDCDRDHRPKRANGRAVPEPCGRGCNLRTQWQQNRSCRVLRRRRPFLFGLTLQCPTVGLRISVGPAVRPVTMLGGHWFVPQGHWFPRACESGRSLGSSGDERIEASRPHRAGDLRILHPFHSSGSHPRGRPRRPPAPQCAAFS